VAYDLSSSIRRRQVEAGPRDSVVLRLGLSELVPPSAIEQIAIDGVTAATRAVQGSLRVLGVNYWPPAELAISIEPIAARAILLRDLVAAMRPSGTTLPREVSIALIERLAEILAQLHRTSDAQGNPAVHGSLGMSAVLLDPSGAVRLIGTVSTALNNLLVPPMVQRADQLRLLAPELARKEAIDARADVYALGAMAFELLSGAAYREELSADALLIASLDGQQADVPGWLADVQPQLARVLSAALAPDPSNRFIGTTDFAQALRSVLTAGAPGSEAALGLVRAIARHPLEEYAHGPQVLLAREPPTPKTAAVAPSFHQAMEEEATVRISEEAPAFGAPALHVIAPRPAPGPAPPHAAAAPERAGWSEVLGEIGDSSDEETTPHLLSPPPAAALPSPPSPTGAPREAAPRSAAEAPAAATLPLPIGAARPPKIEAFSGLDARAEASFRPTEAKTPAEFPVALAVVAGLLLLAGGIWLLQPSNGLSRADRPARTSRDEHASRGHAVATPGPPPSVAPPPAPTPTSPAPAPTPVRAPAPAPVPATAAPTPAPAPAPPTPVAAAPGVASPGASGPAATPSPSPSPASHILTVLSKPSGASVEIGGGYVGKTPLVMQHSFQPEQQIHVSVLAEGFRPWERDIAIDSTGKASIMAVLVSGPGRSASGSGSGRVP
jgi:hypothetical protein